MIVNFILDMSKFGMGVGFRPIILFTITLEEKYIPNCPKNFVNHNVLKESI